jgi:hypothetical protein
VIVKRVGAIGQPAPLHADIWYRKHAPLMMFRPPPRAHFSRRLPPVITAAPSPTGVKHRGFMRNVGRLLKPN